MYERVPPRLRRMLSDQPIDRIGTALAHRLGIDLRALAAFRIAIGSLLLADLVLRLRNFRAFYTDAGVLPREALFSDYGTVYSLHAHLPEPWMVLGLFVVAMGFAVAVIVGYHTRIAIAVSWLLLLSLHARNLMVLNGGDTLLRLLLFWGIFLPLDRRWAIGGADRSFDTTRTVSIATVAILVQMLMMYAINAVHKFDSDPWPTGIAAKEVFQAEQFMTPIAPLFEISPLLETFTFLWVTLVAISPLLVVLTGYRRAALVTLFVGMHVGMGVMMRIGLFPLIAVAGLLLFYPPAVWDGIETAIDRYRPVERIRPLASRLPGIGDLSKSDGDLTTDGGAPVDDSESDEDAPADGRQSTDATADEAVDAGNDGASNTEQTGSNEEPEPSSDPLPGERWSRRSDSPRLSGTIDVCRTVVFLLVPALFLWLTVMSGAASVDAAEVPDPGERVLEVTETDQHWSMFAPNPVSTARWFAYPAVLEDGREVDAFRGGEATYDPPRTVATNLSSARWRKYHANMRFADNENHRSYLAHHLCASWNQDHEVQMEHVEVYYHYEHYDPFAEEIESQDEFSLIEYDCDGELIQN